MKWLKPVLWVCAMLLLIATAAAIYQGWKQLNAIIDPSGKLVANLEGNEFTADQLGDLTQTVLDGAKLR